MTSFEKLEKEAVEAAEWRGHKLVPFQQHEWKRNVCWSDCVKCGMGVCVNIRPLPNEIDIGGEAVALNCEE